MRGTHFPAYYNISDLVWHWNTSRYKTHRVQNISRSALAANNTLQGANLVSWCKTSGWACRAALVVNLISLRGREGQYQCTWTIQNGFNYRALLCWTRRWCCEDGRRAGDGCRLVSWERKDNGVNPRDHKNGCEKLKLHFDGGWFIFLRILNLAVRDFSRKKSFECWQSWLSGYLVDLMNEFVGVLIHVY